MSLWKAAYLGDRLRLCHNTGARDMLSFQAISFHKYLLSLAKGGSDGCMNVVVLSCGTQGSDISHVVQFIDQGDAEASRVDGDK